MNYFVTAIGTDSGKSLFSAILTEALQANYWKPIQAGYPKDTDYVKGLVQNGKSVFHSEQYVLETPASPHYAAEVDGVELTTSGFTLPKTTNNLVVEGAGGALVPINQDEFVIDLAIHFKMPVFLVANLYLGSINHTLLSIEALRSRSIEIAGLIFNGPENLSSQQIIEKYLGQKALLHIQQEKDITKEVVSRYAKKFLTAWERK
jgi:dethiobiotin synthetase